jgi:F-box/leucine-rich repeat protein 2/20
LKCSPHLTHLDVHGLDFVTSDTCAILARDTPRLVSLDVGSCNNLKGTGLFFFVVNAKCSLRTLCASNLKGVSDSLLGQLGAQQPDLVDLDVGYSTNLTDAGIAAFVSCNEDFKVEKIELPSYRLGLPDEAGTIVRRVTGLRRLCLTGCIRLTDRTCEHLAYAVPKLEFLEMANIGPRLHDDGFVKLFKTTPMIRKVDLEYALGLTDKTVHALTPPAAGLFVHSNNNNRKIMMMREEEQQPGSQLEHVVFSHMAHISEGAVSLLIKNCTRLTVLEVDNTRLGENVVREFVKTARARKIRGAEIGAVDCSMVGRAAASELGGMTRTRRGSRSWASRLFGYHEEGRGVCEFDESKVVFHTFWSWMRLDEADRERLSGGSRYKMMTRGRFRFRSGTRGGRGREEGEAEAEAEEISPDDVILDGGARTWFTARGYECVVS